MRHVVTKLREAVRYLNSATLFTAMLTALLLTYTLKRSARIASTDPAGGVPNIEHIGIPSPLLRSSPAVRRRHGRISAFRGAKLIV